MSETTIVGDSVGVARLPAQGAWAGSWSGISWSSIIAGTFAALAVSFIIIALGTGIGMVVASPYASASSPSAETMTVIGALWLVFSQAVGFAVGGYVAGRARRTPAGLHSSEVKFRDGANGLVVWAVGVVVTSLLLASAVEKAGSAAGRTAGMAAIGLAGATSQAPPIAYFSDALLRPAPQGNGSANAAGAAASSAPAAAGGTGESSTAPSNGNSANNGNSGNAGANNGNANEQRAQVGRILVTSLGPNGISNDDRTYLAQVVSSQTGMSQSDAQNRVNSVIDQLKDQTTKAADAARKAAAFLSFWTFMSLLFGAACATLGGILGGDLRDEFAVRQAVSISPR